MNETFSMVYSIVKDFGFPAAVAAYVLSRVSRELERLTRELHKLVLVVVAREGKVPPELLSD
jgi:hypothetical protein